MIPLANSGLLVVEISECIGAIQELRRGSGRAGITTRDARRRAVLRAFFGRPLVTIMGFIILAFAMAATASTSSRAIFLVAAVASVTVNRQARQATDEQQHNAVFSDPLHVINLSMLPTGQPQRGPTSR
ncbi:MAG: hypothetical protein ACC619_01615, partial [Paracoccaceae bacterium]